MREQERQVLEKAIKTINIMIESEIKEGVNTKFCMMYLEDTINDLIGYASIQYRFAGMKERDFEEFYYIVNEFYRVMYHKINNAEKNL